MLKTAKEAFEATKAKWKKNAKVEHDLTAPTQPSDLVYTQILPRISNFFKLTSEKTLTSLVEELQKQVDSTEAIPHDRKDFVKSSLKVFVFGDPRMRQLNYKKTAAVTGMLNRAFSMGKQLYQDPIYYIMPPVARNAIVPVTKPINNAVGRVLGAAAAPLSAKAIDLLKLQQLEQLIPEKDIALDLSPLLPMGSEIPMPMKELTALTDGIIRRMQRQAGIQPSSQIAHFDFNQTLQQLIQQMGEKMADRLSYLLAEHLKETSKCNYTPADLMTKKVGGWFS